ncbi:uncharacterized protein [Narcine bancroftii]|uniref:uncharacterized protein n=1 Tax=Narcine bancroftii TaxID=1343680 RepID=UPI0038315A70
MVKNKCLSGRCSSGVSKSLKQSAASGGSSSERSAAESPRTWNGSDPWETYLWFPWLEAALHPGADGASLLGVELRALGARADRSSVTLRRLSSPQCTWSSWEAEVASRKQHVTVPAAFEHCLLPDSASKRLPLPRTSRHGRAFPASQPDTQAHPASGIPRSPGQTRRDAPSLSLPPPPPPRGAGHTLPHSAAPCHKDQHRTVPAKSKRCNQPFRLIVNPNAIDPAQPFTESYTFTQGKPPSPLLPLLSPPLSLPPVILNSN